MRTLDLDEAAAFLQMCPAVLCRHAREGRLQGGQTRPPLGVSRRRPCRVPRPALRWPQASAAKWLQQGEILMGVYKRGDVWWVHLTSPNGMRVRRSAGTADERQALEFHDRLKVQLWEEERLGIKPQRSWQDAAVRWVKETRDKRTHGKDVAKLRWLDRYLGHLQLSQVTRDVIDAIAERKVRESSRSTANRYLALIRAILRRARDEWNWLDTIPKVRLYREPKGRIRFLTPEEARRLLDELPPIFGRWRNSRLPRA